MASFGVDEDMSNSIARVLREAGHDAIHIREAGLQGSPDLVVFQFAQTRNATIITEDVGFGDIRAYPLGSHAGIILLRMPEEVPYYFRVDRIMDVLPDELDAGLIGCLLVVEPTTVRRREP